MDNRRRSRSTSRTRPEVLHYLTLSLPIIHDTRTLWPEMELLTRDELLDRGVHGIRELPAAHKQFACCIQDRSVEVSAEDQPYPEEFWRGLAFKWAEPFEHSEENVDSLGSFYAQFGPVTSLGVQNGYESIVAARRAINWLACLIDLTTRMEEEDYEWLWGWFRSRVDTPDNREYFRAKIPATDGFETLSISFLPNDSNAEWSPPPHPLPKDLRDLQLRVSRAIMVAITGRLADMRQRPVSGAPWSPWFIEVRGALDAALVQWLTQRLSIPFSCRGCNRPLPAGRDVWCSDRCRERVYKQRQRDRRMRLVARTAGKELSL